MRNLIILGSTGSIGTQALEVIKKYKDKFNVVALTANKNSGLLFEQVREFKPKFAGLVDGEVDIPEDISKDCKWVFGKNTLKTLISELDFDDVLVSVVGMSSLEAVMLALKKGKRVLLANKETLVAGGHIIMPLARCFGDDPNLIPVDSEHSAIYQCLQASQGNKIEKILLTASGGPFRDKTREEILNAGVKEALKHPNWSMGAKISIDSASMFNKALEMIEAKWLFDLRPNQIEVLIHPESIVHSMIQFTDGAVLAQLGIPDMKLPIMYAMSYPKRMERLSDELSFKKMLNLSFRPVDFERFPAIKLAYEVLNSGNMYSCILNAANEIAVEYFLKEKIPFGSIYGTVEKILSLNHKYSFNTIEDILFVDSDIRRLTRELLSK